MKKIVLAGLTLAFAMAANAEDAAPSWTDKISINADARFRHEYTSKTRATDTAESHKERMRVRFNVNGKVNDKLTAKLRLATADGANPISTNTTWTDNSSKKTIFIDVLAVDYKLCEDANLVLGKQEMNLRPIGRSQLVYDDDYTPEGLAINGNKPIFARIGVFSIQERSPQATDGTSEPDSWLMAGLAGYKNDHLLVALGYHNFTALKKNAALTGGFLGNSSTGTGAAARYVNDYQVGEVLAEVKWKLSGGTLSVYADYINNFTADEDNTGELAGTQFQTMDDAGKPLWTFSYTYQATGKDATVSAVNNSDINNGIDGGFGHIVTVGRTVAANTNLNLAVFRGKVMDVSAAGTPFWIDRVFADVVVNF